MKGGSTSSKNAAKLARDRAGELVEKTRKCVDELRLRLVSLQQEDLAPAPTLPLESISPLHNQKSSVLSEHTGSPSHEDSISSVHHLASEEIQNTENNSSSPSRERLETIHSSALGEELREHSPVHHSASGRSQNGDNDSSLCSREQLESRIHNSASRRGSQSQQPDLANELPGSKATAEASGDSQQPCFANEQPNSTATTDSSGDSQELDVSTATTEVGGRGKRVHGNGIQDRDMDVQSVETRESDVDKNSNDEIEDKDLLKQRLQHLRKSVNKRATRITNIKVEINAVKAMVEACATILSDSLDHLAAGPNSKPEAEALVDTISNAKVERTQASSSLDDLQQELELEEKAQEIDRELVCQIEALQNARSKLNEAYKSRSQRNLLIHKKQARRRTWEATRTEVEKLERVLRPLLSKRKRTEDAETKGRKKTKGEPAKPNEQSKWEEMEDEDKNELKEQINAAIVHFMRDKTPLTSHLKNFIRCVQELAPEASWLSRDLAKHIFNTSQKHYICRFHHIRRSAKGPGMYIDGMRAMVEGIAFKRNTAAKPPAGFWHCGCDEDAALFEFFMWKRWKIRSTNPRFTKVDVFGPEEAIGCQIRGFIIQNTLMLAHLKINDLYSLTASSEEEHDRYLLSVQQSKFCIMEDMENLLKIKEKEIEKKEMEVEEEL
ncbi:hypothetical protein BDQ12DRAFT_717248 [Crucibulum laeve]|uniref:Uncharacterized protein n=1 Tax=Crucibulum laeve TaxID=68775 RepID=A0A5C3MF63_9AGAR|nr:hypothetical protein BDQ12DRAFT_717248 [Crucibulum laeve]